MFSCRIIALIVCNLIHFQNNILRTFVNCYDDNKINNNMATPDITNVEIVASTLETEMKALVRDHERNFPTTRIVFTIEICSIKASEKTPL